MYECLDHRVLDEILTVSGIARERDGDRHEAGVLASVQILEGATDDDQIH